MILNIESDDGDVRHGDREDQAEQQVEYLERKDDGTTKNVKPRKETLVCSCGSTTCLAISRFGHPRPVFAQEIEPISCQTRRDRRALVLKQAG